MEYLACAEPLRRAGLSAAAETLVSLNHSRNIISAYFAVTALYHSVL